MILISVPNYGNNLLDITIDGVSYGLSLTYNAEEEYWSLGVYNADNAPIISQMKIVPNYPINRYFWREDMPQGIFTVVTPLEKLDRESFNNGQAELYYIPYIELPSEVREYAR